MLNECCADLARKFVYKLKIHTLLWSIQSKLFSDRTLTHKFLSTYLNRHKQQRRIQCKPVEEAFWSKSSRVESNRVESLQLAVLVKSARPGVTLPAWRHFKTASAAADSFASWFDWDKGFHIHRYIKKEMYVCVCVCLFWSRASFLSNGRGVNKSSPCCCESVSMSGQSFKL